MNNTVTLDLNRYHDLIAKEIAIEEKGRVIVFPEYGPRLEIWKVDDLFEKLTESHKQMEKAKNQAISKCREYEIELSKAETEKTDWKECSEIHYDAFKKEHERRLELEDLIKESKTDNKPPEKVDSNPFQKYLFSEGDSHWSKRLHTITMSLLYFIGGLTFCYIAYQVLSRIFKL